MDPASFSPLGCLSSWGKPLGDHSWASSPPSAFLPSQALSQKHNTTFTVSKQEESHTASHRQNQPWLQVTYWVAHSSFM